MDGVLKNKIIVVTGGAGGIGYDICDKYLEQGAKIVIIIDIDQTQGDNATQTLEAKHGANRTIFIKGNVATDLDKVYKTITDSYKTIDVLVQVAGTADESVPRTLIEINLTSIIEWSLKFKEIMRTDKGFNGGTIVLVSSIFGFRVTPFYSIYQASKFGVVGFAKSMGHENNFKETGVRVVALCPGYTETAFSQRFRDAEYLKTLPQDFLSYLSKQVWQKVVDVGDAAVEVFKTASSGTVWQIEGGKLTEVI